MDILAETSHGFAGQNCRMDLRVIAWICESTHGFAGQIVAWICGPCLRMDMRSQGHGLAKKCRPVWARSPLTHISGLSGRGPASGSSSGSLRSGVRSPGSSRPAPVGLNVGCRRVLADKGARKGAPPFLTLPVPGRVFLIGRSIAKICTPGQKASHE